MTSAQVAPISTQSKTATAKAANGGIVATATINKAEASKPTAAASAFPELFIARFLPPLQDNLRRKSSHDAQQRSDHASQE